MRVVGETKLYSSNEVCALLGISYVTLLKYWRTGLITSTKIGGRRYTSEKALEDYVNGATQQSESKKK